MTDQAMDQDAAKGKEQLDLDKLEGVSGGTYIVYPVRGKMEEVTILCPRCGMSDVDGLDNGHEFKSVDKLRSFLNHRNFKCRKCGHTELAANFWLNAVPIRPE